LSIFPIVNAEPAAIRFIYEKRGVGDPLFDYYSYYTDYCLLVTALLLVKLFGFEGLDELSSNYGGVGNITVIF
jgi:hypothetical protein